MTTAVVVSIPALDLARVELREHDVLLLEILGPGAVLVRHGPEVYLDYTDLDAIAAYHDKGQGEPPVEVQVHGTLEWGSTPEDRGSAPLHMRAAMGCRAYARVGADWWGLLPREEWADFADFVLDGMTMDALDGRWGLGDLDEVTSQTAALDDDPDSTGSQWVSAYGCPQVLAMCLTGRMSLPQQMAAHQEAQRRAGRAVFWRAGGRPLLGRETEYLMHRGYRSSGGGWEKGDTGDSLYNGKIPPGVPGKIGATPSHPTHGELELAIGLAVMTGSVHLAEAAWGTWQVWVRLVVAHDFMSSRALGRLLRTAALLSFAPGVDLETLAGDVETVLAYQQAREHGGMPSPDWEGNSSYHLNLAQIDELLVKLGMNPDDYPEDVRKSWGDSDCCWMVAQLGHGVRSVKRSLLKPKVEWLNLGRLDALSDLCAAFIGELATTVALDQGSAMFTLPHGNGTFEDVATKGPVRIGRGGGGQNDALGVLGRFWASEVYAMAEDRPKHRERLHALAEPVLATCDAEQRWGSRPESDLLLAVLESQWPVVRARGLPG